MLQVQLCLRVDPSPQTSWPHCTLLPASICIKLQQAASNLRCRPHFQRSPKGQPLPLGCRQLSHPLQLQLLQPQSLQVLSPPRLAKPSPMLLLGLSSILCFRLRRDRLRLQQLPRLDKAAPLDEPSLLPVHRIRAVAAEQNMFDSWLFASSSNAASFIHRPNFDLVPGRVNRPRASSRARGNERVRHRTLIITNTHFVPLLSFQCRCIGYSVMCPSLKSFAAAVTAVATAAVLLLSGCSRFPFHRATGIFSC